MLMAFSAWASCFPSFGLICIPSGRWDEVLVHEREDAITNLLEFSFRFRDVLSLSRTTLAFSFVCILFLSVSDFSRRLRVLTTFSISTFISCFRSSASFAAIVVIASAICKCSLNLPLFLCHDLLYLVRFVLWFSRNRLFNSAAFCSSTSVSASISTWCSFCFLDNFQFLLGCKVFMTLRFLVLGIVPTSSTSFCSFDSPLLLDTLFLLAVGYALLAFCWVCSSTLLLAMLF